MIEVKYQTEAAIIGRLLTGYTDLEIDLLHCVHLAIDDFDKTLKAMFGTRGEKKRITRGADLARPIYASLGLSADFEIAIDAMCHCLLIRNQYAHHNFWDDNSGKLAIGDLEKIACQPAHQTDLGSVVPNYVDAVLLGEQASYFQFADEMLAWVNFEGRFKRGLLTINPHTKPYIQLKPMLHL